MNTSKVEAIVKEFGLKAGALISSITIYKDSEDEETKFTLDYVFNELLKAGKLVEIKGNLSECPEIKTLLSGLVSKGKDVTLVMSGEEDLSPLGLMRAMRIVLEVGEVSEKHNGLKLSNLGLLREGDELHFKVTSTKHYQFLKKYFEGKTITRPTIFFDVRSLMDAGDEKERDAFKKEYIQDSDRFIFKNRCIGWY